MGLEEKLLFAIGMASMLIRAFVIGFIVYVAAHFLSKWW